MFRVSPLRKRWDATIVVQTRFAPAMPTARTHNTLLTWTTYGTWLHGDERRSVFNDGEGWARIEADPDLLAHMQAKLTQPPFLMDSAAREIVAATIGEVCKHRKWTLHAVNVRTNHVHVVAGGEVDAGKMLGDFKAYATRRLREKGNVAQDRRVWSDGGNTLGLRGEKSFNRAVHYVLHEQGPELT